VRTVIRGGDRSFFACFFLSAVVSSVEVELVCEIQRLRTGGGRSVEKKLMVALTYLYEIAGDGAIGYIIIMHKAHVVIF